jgi:YesN/AraC family two-component response regulator
LYQEKEDESLAQTRKILTDTVRNATNENAYFAISQPINMIDEVIPAYHVCRDLITNSYFFDWKNELITQDHIQVSNDTEIMNNKLLYFNASFIRCIVSQNESEIAILFDELEAVLLKIKNASQVKDFYNRFMVELDHEFHFSKLMETGILQASYENKTLVQMMHFSKMLLKKVSNQYGNNDAKENNYCELAKTYLEENHMKDMNITDTADHLDISYSYLSKIFRARTGVTLTDYLNHVRIEKSKEYLSNTFLTLTEISEKVGYNNVQSYQRFFKKYVNITPGDYRKLQQGKT